MKKLFAALLVVGVGLVAAPALTPAAQPYHPDTIITESYYGEGNQYVVWFTAGNINSPNYAIEFQCKVDKNPWYACGLNQETTGLPTYEYLNGLAAGKHAFAVRTLFRGSVDLTPAKVTFVLAQPVANKASPVAVKASHYVWLYCHAPDGQFPYKHYHKQSGVHIDYKCRPGEDIGWWYYRVAPWPH